MFHVEHRITDQLITDQRPNMPLFRKLKTGEYREAKPAEVKSELGRINKSLVKNPSGGKVWSKCSGKDNCRCVQHYLKRGKTIAEIDAMRRPSRFTPNVSRGTLLPDGSAGTLLRRFKPPGMRFPGMRRPDRPKPPQTPPMAAPIDSPDAAVERLLGDLPPRRTPPARPPTGPPPDKPAPAAPPAAPIAPRPKSPDVPRRRGVRSHYFD